MSEQGKELSLLDQTAYRFCGVIYEHVSPDDGSINLEAAGPRVEALQVLLSRESIPEELQSRSFTRAIEIVRQTKGFDELTARAGGALDA
jgi:hypothetical protein